MDYLNLSILCDLAGTLSLIVLYAYLYMMYHERYIGIWIMSWLCHSIKLVSFDSGMLSWNGSISGFIFFQIMNFITILLFLWGIQLFKSKPVKRWWLYGAAGSFLFSILLSLLHLPALYNLFPCAWFSGIILIYIGKTFIYDSKIPGTGLFVTGYAFILWGILKLCMPYTLDVEWSIPWCYFIGGILKLIIASGTLMVYLEKTRINLDKNENQYRLLAENAADVLFHYNLPEAKFEYISPSVLPVTGYKPEDYYADTKLLANLIDPNDLPMFNNLINTPSLADDLTLTFRLIRKDQSMVWMEQKCVPIYNKAGTLVAQVGILRDITTRKNLEQIAARADRINMVGEMASNVAHEIRNPLTTVRGYLQMMTKNKELDRYKKRFELIIAELDRTNTIISEYLLLAKDKRSDLKNCCLNTIIKTLLPIIEADAISSNVTVSLNLTDIPQLYLDETEIRQLLLNLVRNGLEAMPPGGKLTICTYLEYNNVVLSIQDQGTGLPTHVLDNLGTPFLTTKDTGTGLGLPICYRIANRHNAAISIKTDEQGTIFFVYFKLSCLVA